MNPSPRLTIWTLGHSNRTWQEFLSLLHAHRIKCVADVRRFPTSRRFPHFEAKAMAARLAKAGIRYCHLPGLGGRRTRSNPLTSPNQAWRTEGFNAYADHMASGEFQQALARLLALAHGGPTALVCAEALPWRCHRRLLADALLAHGTHVVHILAPGRTMPHQLSPWAHVEGTSVTYPRLALFARGHRG